ncbi:hypothetical protein STEG23_025891, partial [Scotinomys teguina]
MNRRCRVTVKVSHEESTELGIIRCRSSQSPSEEESIPKTQEQPVTLGRRGPKSNQSPLEEEDQGAASHPWKTSPSHFLRYRSSQSPSEEEDPGAASHPLRKKTKEQPPSEEEDPGAPRHHWDKRLPLPPIQGRNEDENLWIASRLVWFDQPRPPDRLSDVPTSRSASRHLTQKMKPHRLIQSRLDHHPKVFLGSELAMARKVGQGEEEEVAQSQEGKREDASLPWRAEDVGVT